MEQNTSDFTQGNILKKLLQFMVPVFGALVLQAMYGAVDMLVVGKCGQAAGGISAISTGSSILNLVIFTISSLSMGVTISISRYIGEKKESRISKVLGGTIAFFALFAVVLAVVMLLGADQFAVWMKAPEEARKLTADYVRICGGGIFFIVAYNVISSIFRGLGNSRLPLLFVLIACVVNIAGDFLFVAVFQWDVAGAALATVFAQAVSVVLSLVIIRKQKLPFSFSVRDIGFSAEVTKFVKLGSPIALQDILTNLSFLALCAFVNRLGIDQSSGYGVAQKIVSFVMLVPSSLMQSMSTFVAQNVGAGQEKRSRQAMFCGMGVGAAVGVFIASGVFFFGDVVSRIFSNDEAYIAQSFSYLKGYALEAVVTSVLFSYMGFFNGHSRTVFVMLQGLAQTFLVRLPLSYIMSIQPDAKLYQIGIAAPTATIFGILLCTVYYIKLRRENTLLPE
ncbi:MAG: MATE family efflux transporter [Clostridiaceae bacterium]|nr:MATE family efflux transporter [Clostridiaceae bacterium]